MTIDDANDDDYYYDVLTIINNGWWMRQRQGETRLRFKYDFPYSKHWQIQ